jgi:hypothetical protein
MADSILSAAGAAIANTGSASAISSMRAGKEVTQVVMDRLLSSIEQAGQSAQQNAPNRIDRVQISPQAMRMWAAEQRN